MCGGGGGIHCTVVYGKVIWAPLDILKSCISKHREERNPAAKKCLDFFNL